MGVFVFNLGSEITWRLQVKKHPRSLWIGPLGFSMFFNESGSKFDEDGGYLRQIWHTLTYPLVPTSLWLSSVSRTSDSSILMCLFFGFVYVRCSPILRMRQGHTLLSTDSIIKEGLGDTMRYHRTALQYCYADICWHSCIFPTFLGMCPNPLDVFPSWIEYFRVPDVFVSKTSISIMYIL